MTLVPQHIILQSPASNDPLLDLNTQPSLDLQFATGKTLNDRVSGLPLVNHQRDASSGKSAGTYVGSDGLIKTSVVNLLTYSDYSQVAGTTTATLEGLAIAPDGTNTARRYSSPVVDSAINKIVSNGIDGTDYTFSAYVRSTGVASQVRLQVGNPTYAELLNISTEWQRLDVTKVNNSGTSVRAYIRTINAGDEVEVWGAQLQEGSAATDYIPTGATISGAPRFDHDPVTGESLGLLIEERRTNYFTNSTPTSTGWGEYNGSSITDNQATGPNGVINSASLVTFPATGGAIPIIGASSTGTSGTVTVSMYVRAVTGTVSLQVGTNVSYGTTQIVGTSWTRIQFTTSTLGSSAGLRSGDVNSAQNFYAWGGQIEEGLFPTSIIPTTSSAVTRAADVADITGTNFSSWYNQSEGTVFVAVDKANQANTVAASLDDGTGDNKIELRSSGSVVTSSRFDINENSIVSYTQQSPNAGAVILRLALAYKAGSVNSAVNGVVNTVNVSASIPNVSRLVFHNSTFLTDRRPGHISRLAYYPYRLADATLQEITS